MIKFSFIGLCAASVLLSACNSSGTSSPPVDTRLDVELTNIELGVDINSPVTVNNRIPVSFTLIGRNANPDMVENIPVSFSFEEKNPINPEEPRICHSNAIDVELTGNGQPQTIDNEFIWPVSECAAIADDGLGVSLTVTFYRGEDPFEGKITTSLPDLELRNGGKDIEYGLTSESSVALLSVDEQGKSETPILTVQSSFVLNGADPYYSVVDASEISDELRESEPEIDDLLNYGFQPEEVAQFNVLPNAASLSYVLIPENSPGTLLDLTIGDDDGSTIKTFEFDSIEVGIPDNVSHDLYLEGSNLAKVSTGGEFENETNFIVRGCVDANFSQDGNGDSVSNDCFDVQIVMVREAAESTQGAASNNVLSRSLGGTRASVGSLLRADNGSITFNKELRRSPGNKRIGIDSSLSTENSLSTDGAFSLSEGKVTLKGKIGKRFNLVLAQATSEAELTPVSAFYDVQLVSFGRTIYSFSDESEAVLTNEDEISIDKSTQLGGLGFGFGPIRLGFTIGAGGRVGITSEDELALVADEAECQDVLNITDEISGCARMSRTVTPAFGMTGKVFGGFKSRFIRAGVKANLHFAETAAPLESALGFGVTNAGRFIVNGKVNWGLSLRLISGRVKLVGSIKIFRRRRSRSVHLFSFSSKEHTYNLIDSSMLTPVELIK